MLTEEALILLAMLGAAGFLALGIVELAWPSKPRRPARRARVTSPARVVAPPLSEPVATVEDEPEIADVASAPAVEALVSALKESSALEPAPSAAPVAQPARPRRSMSAGRAPRAREPRRASVAALDPSPLAEPAAVPGPAAEARLAYELTQEPEAPRRVLPVDTCLAMYKDGRFAEVVSLGSAALEVHARMAAVSDRPDEVSAMLDLVGLAKQELGDSTGARLAFAAAIRDAAPLVRPTYAGHLLSVIRGVADAAADPADGATEAACVEELRASLAALDVARVGGAGDDAIAAADAAVRQALGPACERLLARVVAGEADAHARALVVEVLGDETMPAAWREHLGEQLAAASSAEIGQLTAHAIRSVQDGKDGEALEALERAERLVAALPAGAVADERREELDRRLWWGYTKAGLRRVEMENFEGALEPLFRALHLGGIDDERLAETRSALVRALDAIVDMRATAIEHLAARDAAAAQAHLATLTVLLQDAIGRGLGADDLGDALAKVSQLDQRVRPPSAP